MKFCSGQHCRPHWKKVVGGCWLGFFLCGPDELKTSPGCNLTAGRDSSHLWPWVQDKCMSKEKVLTTGIQGDQLSWFTPKTVTKIVTKKWTHCICTLWFCPKTNETEKVVDSVAFRILIQSERILSTELVTLLTHDCCLTVELVEGRKTRFLLHSSYFFPNSFPMTKKT